MRARALTALERAWTPLVLLGVLLIAVVVLDLFGSVVQSYLIQGFATMILVTGLYMFAGNSGVVSLGHVVFYAVGADIGGILSIPPIQRQAILPAFPIDIQLGLWPAALVSAGVAAILAYVIAVPTSRVTNALAVAVATLAVLEVAQAVLTNWDAVSESGQAVPAIPVDTGPWQAYIGVVVAVLVAFAYQGSRPGARLRASREDPLAAQAVGVNVARERRIAFTLSAAVVSLGGTLYAHAIGVVSPDDFYLTTTLTALAMLVVGGLTSLTGAVVGTVVLSAITDALSQLQDGQTDLFGLSVNLPNGFTVIVMAVIMLIILIKRPAGIMAGREVPFPKRWRTRVVRDAVAAPGVEDAPVAAGGARAEPTT